MNQPTNGAQEAAKTISSPKSKESRGNLILPPSEIFDMKSMEDFMGEAWNSGESSVDCRRSVLNEIGRRDIAAKKLISQVSREEYVLSPYASLRAVQSYSYLTDCVVRAVINQSMGPLNPDATASEEFAVLAVGGYGRGEMAPQSDVDLLFLTAENRSPFVGEIIEVILYQLWDLNLKVGQSVRTIKDCIQFAKSDLTIRTSMLESRLVWGKTELSKDLHDRLWNEVFKGTGPDFVELKLSEREDRYTRQGGNRYALEPNVKEGKGGLRDLQTLFWIVKYLYRVDDARDLISLDVFTIEEFEKFLSAESFLWAVRCELHLMANRPQDTLHFDAQVDVAQALGYRERRGRPAVEHFMQDYFGFATDVGELTRIFLTKLEAQHVKKEPIVTSWLRSAGIRFGEKLPEGYKKVNGRLAVSEPDEFLSDSLNILRLFQQGLATGLLIHPDAMRLVASNLHLIDQRFRETPEANEIFLDLLLNYGNPERALRRMNELGVLGMFIPEFRDIVAMMQYNSYHQYTVDEHTIQSISLLARIEKGELREDLPIASGILERGVNRRVLYIALLLHDVGKGKNADHSKLGATIAQRVGPRLGLDEEESSQVEWLVENHLQMSDAAQKRDINDPKTIEDFARLVETRTRLKLLTVLTVCDIMGVGPGVWNNWKAQMLRDLYAITYQALTEGFPNITHQFGVEESKQKFCEALSTWNEDRLELELTRFPDSYWQGLPTEAHVSIANLIEGIKADEIRSDFTLDKIRDATRVCFAMSDAPGLFPRLAGILSLAGVNIVDGKTFTSSDRHTIAVFWLQDLKGKPYEKARMTRVKTQIRKLIDDPEGTERQLADPTKLRDRKTLKKRARKFMIPTEIKFDNDGSALYTIVEVDTQDRSGLLYDLAITLQEANVSIVSAVIATYGAKAVDVFYVKEKSGFKLLPESRRKKLEKRLRNAIENGSSTPE